ncbi:hypothetical protein K4K57_007528 [Colletotrichum sp. SAR 10_99]|nr:hypothetical protein K4K57_007528 [Colletotrichum sp. SAR 10_99]
MLKECVASEVRQAVMELLSDLPNADAIVENASTTFRKAQAGHMRHEKSIGHHILLAAATNRTVTGGDAFDPLLHKFGNDMNGMEEIVKAAAANRPNGALMIDLLLDKYGEKLQITEDVVKAAASNWQTGNRVMDRFLSRSAGGMQITESMIILIVATFDTNIFGILITKYGAEMKITKTVVESIAANWDTANDNIVLLLDKIGGEVPVTEDAIEAITQLFDVKIFRQLSDPSEGMFQVTDAIVAAAVANHRSGGELTQLLLEDFGAGDMITEDTFKVAAGNWSCGGAVMKVLLDQQATDFKITRDIVEAAASNWHTGEEVMELLLNNCASELGFTDDLVSLVARRFPARILRLVLDNRGTNINITGDILEAGAANWRHGGEVMTLLLKQPTPQAITEFTASMLLSKVDVATARGLLCRLQACAWAKPAIIESAAANRYDGYGVMGLLLQTPEPEIRIDRAIIEAASMNWRTGRRILGLVLEERRANIDLTEEAFSILTAASDGNFLDNAAAANSVHGRQVMGVLLDRCGPDITISEDIVRAAAGNLSSGEDVLHLLIEKCLSGKGITESVVQAIAETFNDTMARLVLQKRGPDTQVTEDTVKAAARNLLYASDVMALLLDERRFDRDITENIVMAAAANRCSGVKAMDVLLARRGPALCITEDVVVVAASNADSGLGILAMLLAKHPHVIRVTGEFVVAAANNAKSGKAIMDLLLRDGSSKVQITANAVNIIAEKFEPATFRVFMANCQTPVRIMEDIIEAAATNKKGGAEILGLLLDNVGGDRITERAVLSMATHFGEPALKLLVERDDLEVPLTEAIVKAFAEKADDAVLQTLLGNRAAEIQATKAIVYAADANPSHRDAVMRLLLEKLGLDNELTAVTEAIVEKFDEASLTCLTNRGTDIQVTEGIIHALINRRSDGTKMASHLFGKSVSRMEITNSVACLVIEGCHSSIVSLMLDNCCRATWDTDKIFKAAAANQKYGKDVMNLLLNDHDLEVTEDIIEVATKNWSCEDMISSVAQNLGSGGDIIALLIKEYGRDMDITEAVITLLVGKFDGRGIDRLLDERGLEVNITDNVIKAAAANWTHGKQVMSLLLDSRSRRISGAGLTEGTLSTLLKNFDATVLGLLLDKVVAPVFITEEIAKAAAENQHSREAIFTLLLRRHGVKVEMADEAMKIALQSLDSMTCLDIIRSQNPTTHHPGRIVELLAESHDETVFVRLLNKYEGDLPITDRCVASLLKRFDESILRHLRWKLRRDFKITEEIIEAAAGNREHEGILRSAAENRRFGQQVITLLLNKYGTRVRVEMTDVTMELVVEHFGTRMFPLLKGLGYTIEMTVGTVKAACENWNWGKEVMALLIEEHGLEKRISGSVVDLIAKHFDSTTFRLLLIKHDFHIELTEGIVKAAVANRCGDGNEVMALLLNKCMVPKSRLQKPWSKLRLQTDTTGK